MHTENPQEKVRRNEIWEESERNRSRTYTSSRRFADSSIAHANFRQRGDMASFSLSVLSADNTLNTGAGRSGETCRVPMRAALQVAVEERGELRFRQCADLLRGDCAILKEDQCGNA